MSNSYPGPSMAGAVDLSGLARKKEAAPPSASTSAGLYAREADDQSVGALVELSQKIPVILEIYGGEATPQLGALIDKYQGKIVLGTVKAEAAPELLKALQLQGFPAVAALVGGQPIPLFQGIPPEAEITPVLDQVLELAEKNGVTGVMPAPEGERVGEEQVRDEPALPPLHQEAFDALSRGDIPAAKEAYEKALKENPADSDAGIGLANVELLARVQDLNLEHARSEAASAPGDVSKALVVADLDMSGGHVVDACARLLGLYSGASDEDKERLRHRLLSYFTIAGSGNDDVRKARNTLTSLMF